VSLFLAIHIPPLLINYLLFVILCWTCATGWVERSLSPVGCWAVLMVMAITYLFWHKPISRYRYRRKHKTGARHYYVRGNKTRSSRVCCRQHKKCDAREQLNHCVLHGQVYRQPQAVQTVMLRSITHFREPKSGQSSVLRLRFISDCTGQLRIHLLHQQHERLL
jgi:hypothetical protein